MKVLIAPDSFKHSLSAVQAARAIERGVKRVIKGAQCTCIPLADGGEGTIQAILFSVAGKLVQHPVAGPLGKRVNAEYALLDDGATAVIEMAQASGLTLVSPAKRNPLKTSSFGTGQLILDAVNRGVSKIIVTLGGSATIDGGAGMAQALGVRFRDADDKIIRQRCNGGSLEHISSIDMSGVHEKLGRIKFIAAVDVWTVLCGENGAAHVFGKQKGATPAMIRLLDNNLHNYAGVIRQSLGVELQNLGGAGAAGGLGGGLVAFTGAEMASGIDMVLEYTGFAAQIADADVVITGEGRIDSQSMLGKTISGVSRAARRAGVPVIAIGGVITDSAHTMLKLDVDAMESAVAMDMPLDQAIKNAASYVSNAAQRAMSMLLTGKKFFSQ